MASKPRLYTYFRSSCAWRVRIAMTYKGIEYEPCVINLVKDGGEQHSEKYRQVNPMEQVPALEISGKVLTQSLAILEYLEEAYPEKLALLPQDPFLRAKVREICQLIGSGIQPLMKAGADMKLDETKRNEWAHDAIVKGFKALEEILKRTSGEYCVGNNVTLADCCLVPQVFKAHRFNIDMTAFPLILEIATNLEKLEPFQVAHPKNQPDCPA